MTEKSAHGEGLASQLDESKTTLAAEDRVGPGHPPRNTRWKKGDPSPNPLGRPRKERSMLPDLKKVLEQALNKKVRVSRGNRKVFMTRLEIGLEQLLNQFAAGDRHARNDLMKLAERTGIDLLAKHKQSIEEALAPSHQAILDAYVARRTGAANVAAAKAVLALAELLDDEPDETEQPQSSLRSPPRPSGASEEEDRQELRATLQKLDQASYGPGHPPPGGFSVTTGKPT